LQAKKFGKHHYTIGGVLIYGNIMGYQIFGYVLMDNHYHVVIQPMDKKLQQITLKEIGDHIRMTAVSVMNMLDKSLE
jgi:hypothetical protein